MDPLLVVALSTGLAMPFHWIVRRYISVHTDPARLREQGVIIVDLSALQAHSGSIGEYLGRQIWGSVTFRGMVYRFDHVAHRRDRFRTGPRELFLDPGLVYRTD